jgi:1-acyl-sn-glycerol-3-phosphate acyltransferase
MTAEPATPSAWDILIIVGFAPAVGFALGMIRGSDPELATVRAVGVAVGAVAALLYWHAYRGTGFVPYALTLAAGAGLWAAVAGRWCEGTVAAATAGIGLALMSCLISLIVRSRVGVWGVAGFLLAVWVAGRAHNAPTPAGPTDFAVLASLLALFAWYWFFRPWFELTCEPVLWVMYRIRAAGPGAKEIPPLGPCLVVANHGSWLDPLFLAKVLPRRTTPMMTAKFYDKPGLRWLMRRFGVIRVPEKALKQDTPEIQEAIAALDRGECVVIFPEGFLRRTDERPLKRFGRGVWQILAERPDTPVFACWIEGAWGSYCSYWNGPPTKNKKPDRRRPIGIGVSAAVTVPAAELANHLATRIHLMNRVLEARTHLGLPALPAVELPTREEDAE